METTRVIAGAFTELYRGAKTFDAWCKIENNGNYDCPIEACLDAKSVYESIVHADLKTPKRSLSSIYSVGWGNTCHTSASGVCGGLRPGTCSRMDWIRAPFAEGLSWLHLLEGDGRWIIPPSVHGQQFSHTMNRQTTMSSMWARTSDADISHTVVEHVRACIHFPWWSHVYFAWGFRYRTFFL